MESNRALLFVLILIGTIAGANLIMYVLVRSATKSSGKKFLESMGDWIATSTRQKDNPTDELRRRMEELQKDRKDHAGDSE